MRRSETSADVSPIPSSLVAFRPRQVIFSEHNRTNSARLKSMTTNQSEQELILSYSVALWLEKKGFSKVLKRFLSAAQIQDDEWKAKALNLNEIFSIYMEKNVDVRKDLHPDKREHGDKNHKASFEIESQTQKNNKKKNGELTDNGTEKAEHQTVEKQRDKKKKKSQSFDDKENKIDSKPEAIEKIQEGLISNGSLQRCDQVISDESKHKKKKHLKTDDPLNIDRNVNLDKKEDYVHLKDCQEPEKKTKKEKKIKVEESTPTELPDATENKDESTKASKKRKRKAPDENETQSGREDAGEESKPKKTKNLEESKNFQPQQNEHSHEQSLQDGHMNSQNLSAKQNEKAINSNGVNKSAKKQLKNSAEPKSANVFQRVKVDEVEFVDDRLQDNSYWAKDGADTGYGAKAQEVLGQVKGRDFRHEKTKKKRGSYRGGQIDLQSHSVKFNYSDNEE